MRTMTNEQTQNLFDVNGKIALVTGGGTGIGKMIAKTLVLGGAKVYISSRKMKIIQETAKELNKEYDKLVSQRNESNHHENPVDSFLNQETKRCIPIQADLTSKKGCNELARKLKEDEGESKLHILVNNAGMSWGSSFNDFDEPNGWDRLMAINVKSIFYLTASLVDLLTLAANGNKDPARVINLSSVISFQSNAETPLSGENNGIWSYAASKAAVNHLTRVLAKTLASKYISVNAIAPGIFPSKMTEFGIKNAKELLESNQPMGRLGTFEDIQGITLFLCGKASAHCTGIIIPLDGGENLQSSKL